MDHKQILILTGTARSGTSALTTLLNQHSKICIGMERFKHQMTKRNNYSPFLFTAERFFDFRDEDTNVLPRSRPELVRFYDDMARKFQRATYIGDKIPNLSLKLENICNSIPKVNVIYILRNIYDVASSWQIRAENLQDSWPSDFDFMMAVKKWNQQNLALEKLIDNTVVDKRIHIVIFESFFSGKENGLDKLLNFLGLDCEEKIGDGFNKSVKYYNEKVKIKTNVLTEEQIHEMRGTIDFDVYENLKRYGSVLR